MSYSRLVRSWSQSGVTAKLLSDTVPELCLLGTPAASHLGNGTCRSGAPTGPPEWHPWELSPELCTRDRSCASEGPELATPLGADTESSFVFCHCPDENSPSLSCWGTDTMAALCSFISSAPIGASLWNVGGGGDASRWETHLLHTRSHLRPQTSASSAPLGCKAPSCFRPGMSGSRHKLLVQTLRPGTPAARFRVRGPHLIGCWL